VVEDHRQRISIGGKKATFDAVKILQQISSLSTIAELRDPLKFSHLSEMFTVN
jgi:hypothetical protein